jgi:hypothetical protein
MQARQAVALLDKRLASADGLAAIPDTAEDWLAKFVTVGSPGTGSDDDAVQFFLASAAYGRARKDVQPPLARPTMRLLLQLPTSDRSATIDAREFRKTLDALQKGSGIRAP